MKKILITGHRGLLGSACVRHFLESGTYDVITSGPSWSRGSIDWRDEEQTARCIDMIKPDIIIHCAAKVGGVKANKDQPVDFLRDNLRMQTNVITSAHENDVQNLVFIGTSCMFPRDAVLPVSEDSLMTGKLEDSVEAYAIAKIAGWRLCKAYFEQYGRHYITVNPSNIYGLNDNYSARAHVIPALIRRALEARDNLQPLDVWGDGSAVREFIFADDVASAIEAALMHWHSPEVLSIGTGESTTIRDLTELIFQQIGYDGGINWDISQPTGIPRKTFDVHRLMELGWSPKTSLEEGLKVTIQDFIRKKPEYLS